MSGSRSNVHLSIVVTRSTKTFYTLVAWKNQTHILEWFKKAFSDLHRPSTLCHTKDYRKLGSFDVVIGSDVVYELQAFTELVHTLRAFCRSSTLIASTGGLTSKGSSSKRSHPHLYNNKGHVASSFVYSIPGFSSSARGAWASP